MSLAWKIVIGVVVFVILAIAGFSYWFINYELKIDDLVISQEETTIVKVEKADEWLQKLQKDNKFNGAVLLIKNDTILLKKTYGFTDFTKSEKLTNNSSFRLASVSKQFTATGIMLLKEQGKLNFDDAIIKYLPSLTYSSVTIRNLLNHTSGVPDIYMDFPKKYKKEIGEVLTISKMVTLLAKEGKPLKNKPNEVYQYNNTGYVLLAAIIERISEKSFEDFMQVELFDKLNMKNTRVWNLVSKGSTFENKTKSFDNVMGETFDLKPGILDGIAGDGGIFSSIDDFVIWNQFWYKNDLLSEETMKEAYKMPVLNNGKESDYGFGWVITKNKAVWHNGSWLGARTLIVRNEQLKNCMVVLDNSSNVNKDNIANQLVKVLK
ncbi:CubicO group peptidase (beta-lactamase class C family) [Lutibacter sp. Hel_I_33_5]|uniref:serine hydrolase domain-containing protein n=1 Tax=Lutibacter sp. Hel_I_33_5 TaxID=1566289 RepID=UPI0011A47986|nr:serine hydrolase domain-containing protein [Lutibacter sp. Hel_I_33_5]TVZ56123.1 CubicO group peptidase (beta-lactamase class C family) [Lutibacter sp. Hel_I_33_5]